MKTFRELLAVVVVLVVLAIVFVLAADAQEPPKNPEPTEQVAIAETVIMMQAARSEIAEVESRTTIPQLRQQLQQWATQYNKLLEEYRKKYGADGCGLNAKQEWNCPKPEEKPSAENVK